MKDELLRTIIEQKLATGMFRPKCCRRHHV
jgi:hypothetical protein